MSAETAAERLLAEGLACNQAGDVAGAERAYRAAADASPKWSVPLYNLGLLCKYQGRWDESFAFNQRAVALSPEHEASNWNLGIAATALGRWTEARHAWTACGITVPPGEGAPEFAWGSVPVRLDPQTNGEVVWAKRLDPARARILNVPLPSSAFRFGDVVLIDGAPEGERVVNGRSYPVFNVLQRLKASTYATFVVEFVSITDAAMVALEELAEARGGTAEHWGSDTHILCRDCSYGRPHEHPEHPATPAHPHSGIAARSAAEVEAIISQWLATTDGVDVARWYAVDAATE